MREKTPTNQSERASNKMLKLGYLTFTVSLLTILAAFGCDNRDLRPLNPCTISGVSAKIKVTNLDNVDLLFMIDNSKSMLAEQTNLTNELRRLVSILASGDIDGDGTQEFPGVKSLRVGVVSSDMGTAGHSVQSCSNSAEGDDGKLQNLGNTAISGCQGNYPKFLEFSAGADTAAFSTDATCVASLGTSGCGFEQQLDAVLKALTTSQSGITFGLTNSVGHGDGFNQGFLRSDSLLTIINITDENDCSFRPEASEIANPGTTGEYAGELNLRCFANPQALQPISRYVDGLLALREDPDLLVYAAITGVPEDLVTSNADYDVMLADPRMMETIDAAQPRQLAPACTIVRSAGGEPEVAFPGRRFIEVARGLEAAGANAVIQSICAPDFTGALDAIIKKIADVLGGACLPRQLNKNSAGLVDCDVIEVEPAGVTCAMLEGIGRDPVAVRIEDGRDVCRVKQLVSDGVAAPAGLGWYYDNFSQDVLTRCAETPQRITFAQGSTPMTGSLVKLECLQNAAGSSGMITDGSPCNDNAGCAGGAIDNLVCDPAERVCRQSCTSDTDCLGGYRCADPAATGLFLCYNPTCG